MSEPTQFDPVAMLAERFVRAIESAYPQVGGGARAMISPSRRAELGDFQSNAAMPLGKKLGCPPREVAATIIEHLDLGDLAEPVAEDAIAGPGFINVRLKPSAMASLLDRLDREDLGLAQDEAAAAETVVVDLVGVNLAKQMHVGHLRSMIIGDSIARIMQRLGSRVVRQNHVGDWGLPIAMVTARVAREIQQGRLTLDGLTLEDLDRLYRLAQRECSPDRRGLAVVERFGLGPKAHAELQAQVSGAEAALALAKETLLRLQAQDPQTVRVWERIAQVTLDECLAVCHRLGVAIEPGDSAGESSYADELGELVDDLVDRGIAESSDGALVVRVEGLDQPCLVRKSDGGFLYATTDLAGIRRRVQQLGADRAIYCVDARQSLHFKQVFAAAIRAGYATRPGHTEPARLEHAAFGMVLGEDHRPFKTRSGENVRLSALVDEAIERADRVVAQKNESLDDADRRPIARAIAIAAIKYADLSNDRVKDYVFSFDRMLAFEGNTGPYLLYAVVRIRSIFRKSIQRGVGEAWRSAAMDPIEPAERALALRLLAYPATVRSIGASLEPHRLCLYLFELATAFSAFFDACPVLGADDERVRDSRLRMCDLTARVLADGLGCLGIETLERM